METTQTEKPTRVFSIITDEAYEFDSKTTPEWALAYAYCTNKNLASALFASAHEKRFFEFFKTLPVERGKKTMLLGDWAVVVSKN